MIVLSGASASGKTEVAKYLASHYHIDKVITTTTREMRNGEQNGKDYFFVNEETFKQMIEDDKFVEYTFYNGNYYGSTKDQIRSNCCIVIDPVGLKAYVEIHDKNIVTFFLDALEDTRLMRMLERGDSKEKAEQRIINDRVAFKKENVAIVDYHVDSEHYDIAAVAAEIYRLYQEHFK